MLLETNRLRLIPLSLDDLRTCIENKPEVERRLGLNVTGKYLDDMMKGIYKIKVDIISSNEEGYLFCTYWQIILKDSNCIIGEVGFKGVPNDSGEIEVGYGIDDEYQNNGYMTEALKELVSWALAQENVSAVIASTDKGNIASQRVLQKAGMERYNEDESLLWWRIQN